MLRRVRIEVVEATPEEAVEALMKYLHSIEVTEADRYKVRIREVADRMVGRPFKDGDRRDGEWLTWDAALVSRDFFNSELGAQLTDQHIRYDESLPGFLGRMVVEFRRMDTRDSAFTSDAEGTTWAEMMDPDETAGDTLPEGVGQQRD